MKKLYRFMSLKEAQKLSNGVKLVHVGHFNARTDSEGFCFLPEEVKFFFDGEEVSLKPERCIEFLFGIVTNDVLVEFEISDSTFDAMHHGYGYYAVPDWLTDEYYATMCIDEFSTRKYSRDTFKPKRYAMVDDVYGDAVWYDFN